MKLLEGGPCLSVLSMSAWFWLSVFFYFGLSGGDKGKGGLCLSISRSVVGFAQHHLISDCFYRYFFTLTYRCLSTLSSRQGSNPPFASLQTQGAAPPRRARGWGAVREQLRPCGGR